MIQKIFASLLNVFFVIIFVKKGGPIHLISLGRRNYGEINKGILYRRSKKAEPRDHWSGTNLGEISTNWSYLCKSPKDVLYDSSEKNLLNKETKLIHEDKRRVLFCDLERHLEGNNECYPFNKTIKFDEDFLKIVINHNKTICNYPHSEITCFLSTKDGQHQNERVKSEDWQKHPLNTSRFKGLKNMYKIHLIHHFNEFQDFDIN